MPTPPKFPARWKRAENSRHVGNVPPQPCYPGLNHAHPARVDSLLGRGSRGSEVVPGQLPVFGAEPCPSAQLPIVTRPRKGPEHTPRPREVQPGPDEVEPPPRASHLRHAARAQWEREGRLRNGEDGHLSWVVAPSDFPADGWLQGKVYSKSADIVLQGSLHQSRSRSAHTAPFPHTLGPGCRLGPLRNYAITYVRALGTAIAFLMAHVLKSVMRRGTRGFLSAR